MSAHGVFWRTKVLGAGLVCGLWLVGARPTWAQPHALTLAFTGDIMMGTTYPDSIHGTHLPANDGADLLKAPLAILQQADFTAGNLEGTLLERGGRVKRCQNLSLCYAFRTPPRYVNNLVTAGYDFVSIANNHSNDFGPEGLASTRQTLEQAGIAFAGQREVCETAMVERKGLRLGVAAFGHSMVTPHLSRLDEVRRTVRELKQRCDIVIVSFHGGGEGTKFCHVPQGPERCFGEDRGDVRAFAHACVDEGADVVYGHGPHVVRGVELYNDRLIAYSLGNFCTPYRVNLAGRSGYAPVLTVSTTREGVFVEGHIHSFIQERGKGPQPDTANRVAQEMATLTRQDFPQTLLVIAQDGSITRK